MEIVRVCIGEPQTVTFRGRTTDTAIFKQPVEGPVAVRLTNLDGDRQADLSVHGGRDKAIYVYPQEHYPSWASELGRDQLEASQFGENLTVAGAVESGVTIGDVYRVGSARVVVAQPRVPCFKLGIRLKDPNFPNVFLRSGRVGYYLRVLEEGQLQRGDRFELLERPPHGITVDDLWRAVFAERDAGTARRALELLPHIDAGWVQRLRGIARSTQ